MASDSVQLPGDHEPIVGPRLTFRPIGEADLSDLMRWLSDPQVVEFYGDPPATIDELREDYLEADVNPVWRFVIEEGDRGVGEIQYGHPYAGEEFAWKAGIDIFIGDPAARDRGVGTEAIRTMLGYLFEAKGVHLVTIDPEVANGRGIRAYEKAGFRLDGVLRHHAFEHGEYVDTHLMSILEDEWPAARAVWQASPLDDPSGRIAGAA
ncbi:MAG: GNAT family protein [Chloroflexi bacterium]|nr:GNAT family protein [Chloroflexota bacterium]MDA1146046.1 GNAT family protein [Chloroflexota bacterium]